MYKENNRLPFSGTGLCIHRAAASTAKEAPCNWRHYEIRKSVDIDHVWDACCTHVLRAASAVAVFVTAVVLLGARVHVTAGSVKCDMHSVLGAAGKPHVVPVYRHGMGGKSVAGHSQRDAKRLGWLRVSPKRSNK